MASAVLVSCIMPTRDRRPFVDRAVRLWQRQDYGERELVVVDTGVGDVADTVASVPGVRYLRARIGLPLGAARNLACESARGAIIAHWDDDDWMRPDRLSQQVRALRASNAEVCGLGQLTYIDPARRCAWRYTPARHDPPWLAGGTLMYRRDTWRRNRFRPVTVGEDGAFLAGLAPRQMLAMPDDGWYIAVLHPGNSSSRHAADGRWSPLAPREVSRRTQRSRSPGAAVPRSLWEPVENA
jgi:glycosyltransferase involved in cell wall biosynthesis